MLHVPLRAAVTLVHVEEELLPRASVAGTEWANDAEGRHAWIEQRLRALASEVFGPDDQIVRVYAVPGRAPERLLAKASELGCDLIVVGSTGKGAVARALLGSTTTALLRTSRVPVLAVH